MTPPGAQPPPADPAPGAVPPGSYPPAAYPPGSYPPASYPPPSYPPASYPPGSYPPPSYPPPVNGPGPGPGRGQAPFTAQPGILPFRPLSVGDVLEAAFKTFRRNTGSLLGISLAVNLIAAIPAALVATSLAVGWIPPLDLGDPELSVLFSGMVLPMFALLPTMFIVSILLPLFAASAVGEAALGRRTSLSQIWSATRGRIWTAIVMQLLVGALLTGIIVVAGGLIALVAAASNDGSGNGLVAFFVVIVLAAFAAFATWFSVRILFASTALVLEKLGARASLRRSFALTKGRWWRTFGIYLLAQFMAGIASEVLQIPLSMFTSFVLGAATDPTTSGSVGLVGALSVLLTVLVQAVVTPFLAAVASVLYIDARIRREGFDQVLLRTANPGWW